MFGRSRLEFSLPLAASLCAAAWLAGAFAVPAGAGAASTRTPLTPELAKLATPAVAARSPEAQAEAIGMPTEGPGSLVREGGRVIVEARFEAGALARVEALKAAGAKVRLASGRYQAVSLSVDPEDLKAIAAVPGVTAVVPSRAPIVYGTGSATAAATSNGLCEGGSVISQGLQQLNVPAARAAFGARGAGETIGVISDSFNLASKSIEGGPIHTHEAEDETSNDLPGTRSSCSGQQVPVRVIEEAPIAPAEATDEGRAMLQVVHDLAPHAELAFATAYATELDFARNIERLAEPVSAGGAGADVIVDDVGYPYEPFYQEGPVSVAIRRVTEVGVTYLTAAGNDNIFEVEGNKLTENEIGSWEAPEYRPIACPKVIDEATHETSAGCMNFSPSGTDSTFGIEVEPEGTAAIDLQWAEPWYGVETDLDAYLVAVKEGHPEVVAKSTYDNPEDGIPFEEVEWENESAKSSRVVYLVIDRCSGTCNPAAGEGTPRMKFAFAADGSGIEAVQALGSEAEREAAGIVVGPTIFGHAGSAHAITLAAVYYGESASAPKEPEYYSSRGPVTHYFGPVTGTTPAAELAQPEEVVKPNLTATDCASTTFFAQLEGGSYHFCGTSEAAPHAAAAAALMQQTDPLASPSAIATAMGESATPFTEVDEPAAVGAGLLNADGALTALGGSPVEDPPSTAIESPSEEVVTPTPTPAPTVTITKGPSALGNVTRPTFEFTSSRPASFTCQVDGGAAQPCVSPFTVPTALADGAHGFAVTATDSQGRSASSGVYDFTIDTKAPTTKIVGHPKKVTKTRKKSVVARFRLKASESPVTFYCQLDREALRVCGSNVHYRVRPGAHTLKVRAKDQLGNLATSQAVFKFRVKELPPASSSR